jgi:hypothetical protein
MLLLPLLAQVSSYVGEASFTAGCDSELCHLEEPQQPGESAGLNYGYGWVGGGMSRESYKVKVSQTRAVAAMLKMSTQVHTCWLPLLTQQAQKRLCCMYLCGCCAKVVGWSFVQLSLHPDWCEAPLPLPLQVLTIDSLLSHIQATHSHLHHRSTSRSKLEQPASGSHLAGSITSSHTAPHHGSSHHQRSSSRQGHVTFLKVGEA